MAIYQFKSFDADVAYERHVRDLPDIAATRQAAVAYAGEKLMALGDRIFERDFRLEVTNERGLILMSVIIVTTDMTEQR